MAMLELKVVPVAVRTPPLPTEICVVVLYCVVATRVTVSPAANDNVPLTAREHVPPFYGDGPMVTGTPAPTMRLAPACTVKL